MCRFRSYPFQQPTFQNNLRLLSFQRPTFQSCPSLQRSAPLPARLFGSSNSSNHSNHSNNNTNTNNNNSNSNSNNYYNSNNNNNNYDYTNNTSAPLFSRPRRAGSPRSGALGSGGGGRRIMQIGCCCFIYATNIYTPPPINAYSV